METEKIDIVEVAGMTKERKLVKGQEHRQLELQPCPHCNAPTSRLICHYCGRDTDEPHDFQDCQMEGVPVGDFHFAALGETVERNWHCPICKREWREVYLHSCSLSETDEML